MTLTLASMQFSPRIIVSFSRDRVTQWTLGIFLGTFSYCMAALPAAHWLPHPRKRVCRDLRRTGGVKDSSAVRGAQTARLWRPEARTFVLVDSRIINSESSLMVRCLPVVTSLTRLISNSAPLFPI